MTGTGKALACIVVAVMFVVPVASVSQSSFSPASVDESVATDTGDTAAVGDQVDQSQEQDDGEEQIYGGRRYAQSFVPTMVGFTRLEIKIGAQYEIPWWIQWIENFYPEFGAFLIDRYVNLPGDLHVRVYEELDGSPGRSVVHTQIALEDVPAQSRWVEIDFGDKELRVGEQYYIVCYTTGGDSTNCYRWALGTGNPYGDGMAYFSTSGYSWDPLSTQDFCFRTHGQITGDEPDGVTNRWAVLFDINPGPTGNVGHARDCLINHGWQQDHIKLIFEATYDDVKSAFYWLDNMDDQDDISVVCSNCHGSQAGLALADTFLYYEKLDNWLDRCSSSIFYSISACHSASAISYLGQENRIIATACQQDESGSTGFINVFLYCETDYVESYGYDKAPSPNGAFARSDCDLNNDGWVSAEEAFPYAKNWTERFHNDFWNPDNPIHPQIYDGVEGELLITRVQ